MTGRMGDRPGRAKHSRKKRRPAGKSGRRPSAERLAVTKKADIQAAALPHPPAAGAGRRDIGLRRRYRAEKRFRFYGISAVIFGLFFLAALLWSIFSQGISAFWQSEIVLPVALERQIIDPQRQLAANPQAIADPHFLAAVNYPLLLRRALAQKLGAPLDDSASLRAVGGLISPSARGAVRRFLAAHPDSVGTIQSIRFAASADADAAFKGQINFSLPQEKRKISDRQREWIAALAKNGALRQSFNWGLFTFAASANAESSGLAVALIGSFYMMLIVLALALPIGVATAVYLEEYARKSRFTDMIEVNINNLAAVPSIVFGILGLAVFINFLGLPRSASLVGGLVLSLMTLPTIIIAARSALQSVPPSIRAAALGLGASKTQTVFHHVLPLAAPGILTGTIIGLARALGETAPLLLIGMVAFIGNYPRTPLEPATALPVQIYMWASEAERSFVERSSAAIIVLLAFLALMNITAIILRRRFEKRP